MLMLNLISFVVLITPSLAGRQFSSGFKGIKSKPKIESSLERISELGPLLTSCPFTLKENRMDGRIPSTFYEIECIHCNKCGKNGSKCTQLVTDMEAVFYGVDDSSWTEIISVKSGCNCMAVSRRLPADIRT